MDRIYLHVPPEDYAEVKSAGASWDDQSKRWYVTDQKSMRLAQWIDPDSSNDFFNIFSDMAFVASAKIDCFYCGLETEVICIFGDKGRDTQTGQEIEGFTVSNVSAIDTQLQSHLKRWPSYGLRAGVFTNCCANCEAVLDDYLLHSEPGDVYFCISRESSKHIDFVPLSGAVQIQGDYGVELQIS